MKLDRNGFTLAEVLITLTIIGVLAAMTISPILKNMQDQALKTQFKKSVATINTALDGIKSNLGVFPNCFYGYNGGSSNTAECASVFYTELKKQLNIVKDCPNNAYTNGCIPNYSDNGMTAGCPAYYPSNMIGSNQSAFILSDGTIIATYEVSNYPNFMVDINGKKPPNKWGYDVFDIFLFGNNNFLKLNADPTSCFTPSGGGVTTYQMMQDVFK